MTSMGCQDTLMNEARPSARAGAGHGGPRHAKAKGVMPLGLPRLNGPVMGGVALAAGVVASLIPGSMSSAVPIDGIIGRTMDGAGATGPTARMERPAGTVTAAASRGEAREPLLTEARGVTVGDDAEWTMTDSGIGDGVIRDADAQTKAIEEARRKAEDEKKRKAEEQARRKAEEQARAEREAKRAASKTSGTGSGSVTGADGLPDVPASAKGRGIVDAAAALVGQHMDCTMLVTKALHAATGIWYHGWPEDYANFPGAVRVAWEDAQPGDILIYADGTSYDMNGPGHSDHVAIYAGDGYAVHGGWNGNDVAIGPAVTSQGTPTVYRVN